MSRSQHWERIAGLYRSLQYDRRDFLRIFSSSMALATTGGCKWISPSSGVQHIPKLSSIEEHGPLFASLSLFQGLGEGILVETFNGRPIKLEGSHKHLASLGATSPSTQGEVLNLYHTKRVKTDKIPKQKALISYFSRLVEQISRNNGEETLVILPVSSSLWQKSLVFDLKKIWANADFIHFDQDPIYSFPKVMNSLFKKNVIPIFSFSSVDHIYSFDADLFSEFPGRLNYARQWATGRNPSGKMLQVTSFGTMPTLTSSIADFAYLLSPPELHKIVNFIYEELINGNNSEKNSHLSKLAQKITEDLKRLGPRALFIPGPTLSEETQNIVWLINKKINTNGVDFVQNPWPNEVTQRADLRSRLSKPYAHILNLGAFLPEDEDILKFYQESEAEKILFSLYESSWSQSSKIHIGLSHFLESWDAVIAYEGSVYLQQPIINPIYGNKSICEWLYFFVHSRFPRDEEFFTFLKERFNLSKTDRKQALEEGKPIASSSKKIHLTGISVSSFSAEKVNDEPANEYFLVFRTDPYIGFGQNRHNEWLLELPRPLTQLTWDNALILSEALANRLDTKRGDFVEITTAENKTIGLPVTIQPLMPDNVLGTYLGFSENQGIGFNVNHIRPDGAWWVGIKSIKKINKSYPLAVAQKYDELEASSPAQVLKQRELKNPPKEFRRIQSQFKKQLKEQRDSEALEAMLHSPVQWAMVIDLNTCIGCRACSIACQAENNIPNVGKSQVLMGREMHWIRVDEYHRQEDGKVETLFQPLPCMHCEKAPCELVCPVQATVHNEEGINEMVYNRCIGTRFCANNCPYKVRRFNYLSYQVSASSTQSWLLNPDVSVRSRGVMEKCTYCIQRIKEAQRASEISKVETACQSVCPTDAIRFGNMADPKSTVAKNREDERHYAVLSELGTLPRTTYLARVVREEQE